MSATSTPAGKPFKLTKSCLAMLGESLCGNYGVIVRQTSEGLWIVTVQFEGQEGCRAVSTARGGRKVWRNILGAIAFVQENCAPASSVVVEVGGWKLRRLENGV